MQALVRCVARLGLDGATLAAIAAESGLSRPLIRHHLGNRDEIIAALQAYVLTDFTAQTEALEAALPAADPATALIEILFSDVGETAPDLVLAFAALTARAAQDPALREACRATVLEFEAAVARALQTEHPSAPAKEVRRAAQGIVALYFNATSLSPLDMPPVWRDDAKTLAQSLCQNLGATS